MIKLTVAIITYNEEKNIKRCLESVREVADEILIIDSLSTDKTKEIAMSYNCVFIEQKFLGYQDQKNLALERSSHEWVLSLDADEALSEELKASILKVKENPQFDGYRFNRLTGYNGLWVRHCGWYPDKKIRLVKKSKAAWTGGQLHEFLKVEGEVGHLNGDLLHYSFESIAAHVNQTNKYTTTAAIVGHAQGKRSSLAKIVIRPFYTFIKDYFFKRGFLDGKLGFIVCSINALYVFLKYSKLYDLQNGKNL